MKQWARLSIVLLIILIGVTVFSENLKPYPKTRTVDVVDDYFGVKVKDPYRWLENTKSKEVQDWIDAQNKYTDEYMKNVPQVNALLERLKKHDAYDEDSIPTRVYGSKRIFFFRKLQGKDKRLYSMKENENSKAIVLIDPNTWPEEELLGKVVPSNNGKYLVYEKSIGGNEVKSLYILDCDTKKSAKIESLGFNKMHVNWNPENTGFYYSAFSKEKSYKDCSIYFYSIIENLGRKVFPLKEDNGKYRFCFSTSSTESKSNFVIFNSFNNKGKMDVYVENLKEKGVKIKKLLSNVSRLSYLLPIENELYYMEVSEEHENGIIYKIPASSSNRKDWEILVPENENKRILYFNPAGGKILVNYLENAHTKIDIYDTKGKFEKTIPLPMLCSAEMYSMWDSCEVYLSVKSFVVRENYYNYNLNTDEITLFYKRKNIAKYKSSEVVVKQVWYRSKDNTKISMFLVHKKNLKLNGQNPAILYGYGSNSVSIKPHYNLTAVLLLEGDGVYCIPNLRGGGEYGYKWHEDGMGRKKQNTIDDFIYAAKWLIKNKYTNPQKIGIVGASAGGIPVGGAITQCPELFKTALIIKPVLDMVRYNKINPPKRVIKEYGDPNCKDDFKILYSYSPYHHVKKNVDYPSVFIIGAENDVRVGYGAVLKMGAILQNVKNKKNPILVRIEKYSGHVDTIQKENSYKYYAEQFGFVLNQIGVELF